MSTMILAFGFMLLMVSAMAIGVLMGRKPISGTCGGMKALGMDMDCEICGGNPSLCDTDETPAANSGLGKKLDPGLIRNAGRK
jgi:uncharacterized protein